VTTKHRGTFGLPGPVWFRLLLLGGVVVEYWVHKLTGFQLPGARWD